MSMSPNNVIVWLELSRMIPRHFQLLGRGTVSTLTPTVVKVDLTITVNGDVSGS